jgi:hypothetical protein
MGATSIQAFLHKHQNSSLIHKLLEQDRIMIPSKVDFPGEGLIFARCIIVDRYVDDGGDYPKKLIWHKSLFLHLQKFDKSWDANQDSLTE